jgi:hypothetical protein
MVSIPCILSWRIPATSRLSQKVAGKLDHASNPRLYPRLYLAGVRDGLDTQVETVDLCPSITRLYL